MLHLAAIEAHEGGRDDEAVEYLRDIVAMADSTNSIPIVVGHLISTALHAIASDIHAALTDFFL